MKILVWDIPTRLFHWLFAAAFALAWLTAESEAWLAVHLFAGYGLLALVGFRLVWGVLGGRYARFRSFAWSPRAAWRYALAALAGRAERHVGHNPAGSWAIYGLLFLGAATAVLGMFTLGAGEGAGPLAPWAPEALGHAFKEVHEGLAAAMLALVGVHLVGVAWESVLHRENLARAMVTGRKEGRPEAAASRGHGGVGVLLLLAVLAGGWAWFSDGAVAAAPPVAATSSAPPVWRTECGSCHLAYPAEMLPARSWQRVMTGLERHFGDDARLDPRAAAEVLAYLEGHGADRADDALARRFSRGLSSDAVPLRVTETPYWERKHRRVPERVWQDPRVGSKAQCAACHRKAEEGDFSGGSFKRFL